MYRNKQSLSLALLSLVSFIFRQHGVIAFVTSPVQTTKPPLSIRRTQERRYDPIQATSTALPISLLMVWPTQDPKGMAADFPDTKSRVIGGILATLFTWHGITANNLNPVLASSATTIAMSLWSPGLGQAAFCGSFAGMTSFGSVYSTLTGAVITASLFEVLIHRRNKWLGLGGKLSFQAFMATNLTAFLFGFQSPISQFPMSLKAWGGALKASPYMYGMLCGAIGSVLTIFLREIAEFSHNDLQDPVRSSAVIGVLAAMCIGIGGFLDYNGAMIMFGGAFTGMSYPSRLLKGIRPGKQTRTLPSAVSTVFWFGVAGALGGLVHALTLSLGWWTGGWGGKAGTCAFVGVLLFRALEKSVYVVRQQMGWTSLLVEEDGAISGKTDDVSSNSLKAVEVSN
jgi:hypothetical protein